MRTVVVIPTVGWSDRLERALNSLAASGHPARDIVVVLDSAGSIPAELAQLDVRVVTRHKRGGYAAACNSGAVVVDSDSGDPGNALVFLNDDVRLPANWPAAIERLRDPAIGVVGFRVRGERGIRPLYPGSPREGGRVLDGPTLDGCAWAIRAEDFHALGGLDEHYVMYGEETDLFARVQRRGLALWEDDLEIWHDGEGTMGAQTLRRAWYGMRNPVRFSILNESPRGVLRACASLIAHALLPGRATPGDPPHIARKRGLAWPVRVPMAFASLLVNLVALPALLRRRYATHA